MKKRILTRVLVLSLVSIISIFWIASRGIRRGLDLRGGVQIGLRVITDDAIKREDPITPAREKEIRENATIQTMRIIENRLNELGIEETTIQRMTPATNYELQVQVPGTQDPDRIKQIIQATAILELKLVERGPFESAEHAALISAAILFMFGSGAVRGFAVTLAMGLLSNLFTSVYASRTLFDWSLWRKGASLSI
jgi:preprotein translocase subunit SecD